MAVSPYSLTALLCWLRPGIGMGSSRTAVLLGGVALKFPSHKSWGQFLEGLLDNRKETKVATRGDDRHCPLLASVPGGFCNVMQRADALRPGLALKPAPGFSRSEWRELTDQGILKLEVRAEINPKNIGRLPDGRLVVLDFA
jgi:hypothetical protein